MSPGSSKIADFKKVSMGLKNTRYMGRGQDSPKASELLNVRTVKEESRRTKSSMRVPSSASESKGSRVA